MGNIRFRGWEGTEDRQMVFKCGEYKPDETDMRLVTHYIHIGLTRYGHMKRYINYRDYMNNFPAAAYEYEAFKIRLANEVNAGGDILRYHPGKSAEKGEINAFTYKLCVFDYTGNIFCIFSAV